MEEIKEVGQLINDLKSIIFDFIESPTLIKSKALSLTFRDVKEILENFNTSPEHLLILSLNKLIELFSNVEKMHLSSKKINDLSNNLDASKNNNMHVCTYIILSINIFFTLSLNRFCNCWSRL